MHNLLYVSYNPTFSLKKNTNKRTQERLWKLEIETKTQENWESYAFEVAKDLKVTLQCESKL